MLPGGSSLRIAWDQGKDAGRDMGLRMKLSRGVSGGLTALGVVLAVSSAAFAQQTVPANQVTPAPTPTPTPGTIGNPTLENFDLNGTVTRTPTPTPAPAPAPAREAPSTTLAPAPSTSTPAPTPSRDSPPSRTVRTAPTSRPADSATAEPAPVAADPLPQAPVISESDLLPPSAPAPEGGSIWPWLAALAVALGAAGAWWMRRQKSSGEGMAYAGQVPAAEPASRGAATLPRATSPAPSDGITTRIPSDGVSGRAPAGPVLDGGIVSRALQPKLMFELVPLKFESDDKRNVRLTFELVVANIGSAPARDVRIEAKMFNAGPDQDRQIVQFFKMPGALGAKLPPIAPNDRVPLRSRIGMPVGDYQALEMGGKPLVVPMIAVNAIYRGSGGESQDSASWLVGADPSGGEAQKLKPFPLDRAIAATGLAARIHSAGLQR